VKFRLRPSLQRATSLLPFGRVRQCGSHRAVRAVVPAGRVCSEQDDPNRGAADKSQPKCKCWPAFNGSQFSL